ncbi:hypothetical protein INT48_000940 [Thamnidium elegans]|uniref:LysM domain-containing protein n=1 Tax=Thamnidium elegans TaxID=101142 RepID=A0A8H7SQ83_9FUNG|nr:hypothetical protein INT48_000940 [Thamnidium elegans]
MKLIFISAIALFLTQQVIARPAEGCLQNYTITDVDSCFSVAEMFKITEPEFYAMNPGLHHSAQHDCDNLDTGRPFCVCMKSPCAFSHVTPAAPSDQNSTEYLIHAAVNEANATEHILPSNISTAFPSSYSNTRTTPTNSMPASSQTASSKSSATMTNTFSVLTIGIVMTATSMMF